MTRVHLSSLLLLSVALGTPSRAEDANSAAGLVPPEDGGPRRLEVVADSVLVRTEPSESSGQIAAHTRNTIFKNLGCETVDGDEWCKVAPLRGRARGFALARHLQPAKGPDGLTPTGVDDSKSRARRKDFDEETDIQCAQELGQSLGDCGASIARSGGGDATVVVTFPNGFERQLYFTHGEFMRGSATMSGVGTDMEWALQGGTYVIRVDDQAFEIKEAFVLGH